MIYIRTALLGLICILSTAVSPAQTRNSKTSPQPTPVESKPVTQIELQSAVMDLADDYIAVLGEATYLTLREEELSSRGRWLSQSFLRNGVGASVDIASGPNPEVALLDLLVLASLQTWAFEKHWIPQGLPAGSGNQALQRLKEAEIALWESATRFLSATQIENLRLLVRKWIETHPEQTVVSFVRFDEFTDARRAGSAELHQRAWGLLSDLSKATVQVDAARLLGERMLWFAGRYPYILGEQSELTAYRLADQPEARTLIQSAESMNELSGNIKNRLDSLNTDIIRQQTFFFDNMRAERIAAVDHFFERMTTDFLKVVDNLDQRKGAANELASQVQQTLEVSKDLSHEITRTVEAIDQIVVRFTEHGQAEKNEPVQFAEMQSTAEEITRAAHELRLLLTETNDNLLSDETDARLSKFSSFADRFLAKAFVYGLLCICALIGGLFLVKRFSPR